MSFRFPDYLDDVRFESIADGVTPLGYFAILKKSLDFIQRYYLCTYEIEPHELVRSHGEWVKLSGKLPIEQYEYEKRDLVAIAVLMQAVGSCALVTFKPQKDAISPLVGEFPNEITGLMMGLILYDLVQRTVRPGQTPIYFARLNELNGHRLREAIIIMRDKTDKDHKRRFSKLLEIIEDFRQPITLN